MSYRPTGIRGRRGGRFSFYAYVISEDDGLPEEECPVHGWDPPRTEDGTLLIDGVEWHNAPRDAAKGCCCSIVVGLPLEREPCHAFLHKRAWRKAYRHMQKELRYG